jgi:hypothetical protein
MLAALDAAYFMVVDDDDLVSAELVAHVARHSGANGWRIDHGYLWTEGSRLLLEHDDFASICGTSFIVRADLYRLPERAELARVNYIKAMLGSHKSIDRLLGQRDTPLAPLPFRGAIYRIGHAGAHSRSRGVLDRYVLDRALWRTPRLWLGNVQRLRWVTAGVRREFFGADLVSP